MGVTQQQHRGPGLARGLGQQGMAGPAGGGRQAGGWLGGGPVQGAKARPELRGGAGGAGRPGAALGIEAMVDRERQQGPPVRPGPGPGGEQQGQGIPATREADRQGSGRGRIEAAGEGVAGAGQDRGAGLVGAARGRSCHGLEHGRLVTGQARAVTPCTWRRRGR